VGGSASGLPLRGSGPPRWRGRLLGELSGLGSSVILILGDQPRAFGHARPIAASRLRLSDRDVPATATTRHSCSNPRPSAVVSRLRSRRSRRPVSPDAQRNDPSSSVVVYIDKRRIYLPGVPLFRLHQLDPTKPDTGR